LFEPFLSEQSEGLNLGYLQRDILSGISELYIYPNPLIRGTSIQFTVDEEGPLSVDIYNISGSIVRSLITRQYYSQGEHVVPWDGFSETGRMVPAGVYMVILKSRQKVHSQKIIVVR
jgi:serine protease AprX